MIEFGEINVSHIPIGLKEMDEVMLKWICGDQWSRWSLSDCETEMGDNEKLYDVSEKLYYMEQ